MDLYNSDDIVALATPPGTGALAIIRFSGESLSDLYIKLSHKAPKNRKAIFTKIYHPKNNTILDHSIITFFTAPNSFTGEDVIEITCHGGQVVYQSIIDAAVDFGVRVAAPGEFSFRAYLNKKMDLIQIESIASLIGSSSKLSADHSFKHLDGSISRKFIEIKNIVINILSIIENELNFSEEEINFTTIEDIASKLNEIQKQLQEILLGSTFGEGRIGEHRVVILGISNAGKSSLFNAIIGHDRSIISAKPGTTRDTVESYINICGISVCLIDTAGFWESKDPIDKISIKKSSLELNKASLCLIVDEKNPKKIIQSDLFKKINKPYLLIQSKCDNLSPSKQKHASKNEIQVSAKKGHGMQALLTMISTSIKKDVDNDPSMLASITRRQRALIEESLIVIQTALTECSEGERVDILASILHEFVSIMEGVLGRIAPKEVLNNIFSNFCIGK